MALSKADSLHRRISKQDADPLHMGLYGREQQNSLGSSEFSKAVPTNGYGEVEATVFASLDCPGAPRPRPITTAKLAKKVCRIYSPVSTNRKADVGGVGRIGSLHQRRHQQQIEMLRPHTADATTMRQPHTMVGGGVVQGAAMTIPVNADGGCPEPAPVMGVENHRRPTTSDASSQRQQQQRRRDANVGPTPNTSSRAQAAAVEGGGQLRPSTTGGGRRRGTVVAHGGLDTTAAPNANGVGQRVTDGDGDSTRRRRQRIQQQQHQQPIFLRKEGPRRQQTLPGPNNRANNPRASPNNHFDRSLQDSMAGDAEAPPNRYWPSPGGFEAFLRPFIERNQEHLWAYDPAFVGMNHQEAYRYTVGKGNFEAVKRTLLEKEDALRKGTGSFLVADTIQRFRSSSEGRPPTSELSARRGSQRRQTAAKRATVPIESDPFQCGGYNSNKLKREETRRQDLLVHAKGRNNMFCRRKGYEPGDFLKHRSPPGGQNFDSGGASCRRGSVGGAISARKGGARSAKAAAMATESRRKVHQHL